MSSVENTRQECMACGAVDTGASVIRVCTIQRSYGSTTTVKLGPACDWRWVTVIK